MKTASKKVAAVAAATGVVASVGIATAGTASADQTFPQQCSLATWGGPATIQTQGFCGSGKYVTKFRGWDKQVRVGIPGSRGAGTFNNYKWGRMSYKYEVKKVGNATGKSSTKAGYRVKTRLAAKIGKDKISGSGTFKLNKYKGKRTALNTGTIRHKGTTYKYTVRNSLANNYWYNNGTVVLKHGKTTIHSSSTLRTLVMLAFVNNVPYGH